TPPRSRPAGEQVPSARKRAPAKKGPAKKAAPASAEPTVTKATPMKNVPGKKAPAKKVAAARETASRKAVAQESAPPAVADPQGSATSGTQGSATSGGPREASPAKKAAPVKRAAAKKTAPLKKAVKAAASEIAPAVVEPDMTTVPDEPTPSPEERAATSGRETAIRQASASGRAAVTGQAAAEQQATADVRATSRDLAGGTTPAAEPPATAPGQPGAVAPVASTFPPRAKESTDTASVRPATDIRDAPAEQRTEAWARLLADPGHSPELLALAAVQTIGPRAAAWAERIRTAYPSATPDAIARLAVARFTRFGSVSSVLAAVAGSYAPLALLGSAALTHAELTLHVAAAYGIDPADPARAVDLLLIAHVHPEREDAEAALAAAQEHSYEGPALDAAWRLGRMVAAQAGGWAALRAVDRLFPGTSLLAAVLASRAGAATSGTRAILYYRTARDRPSPLA
ncbi:hypothetical protein, partial [Couchioplanes caeruleus]